MDENVQLPVKQSVSPIQQTPQAPQSLRKSQKPFLVLGLIALAVMFGIAFYLMRGSSKSSLNTSAIPTQGNILYPTQDVTQTDKSKNSVLPSGTGTPTSIPIDQSVEKIKNESIIGDKSLVIEKKSYKKGEEVRALFKFGGELFISPEIRISKFENDTWNNLGSWDINSGQQITCCGVVPSCSKYDSVKTSPLQIKWDQKIVNEKSPVLESMTKVQAHSGKYKITVAYGDRPVCIDGINAEFVIE